MIVQLKNIQSYKNYSIEIDEPGCTQIVGDNSNGKSVLIKAISFIAKSNIKHASKREAIINDESESGSIAMSRNGMTLNVIVSRVRENCRYELTRPDGSVIVRTIREGGLEELVDEFGLVVFDEGNICIQIFETFGIWPFVNSKLSVSYEIMDYIITDKVASGFVDNYVNVTFPLLKEQHATLKNMEKSTDEKLSGIVMYDKQAYSSLAKRLSTYSRNLNYLRVCEPKRLPILKSLRYVDISACNPRRLPIYKTAPNPVVVNSLSKMIRDYVTAANGECPTCGTKLKDRRPCEHEV